MESIGKISGVGYYTRLEQEDYYTAQDLKGHWLGQGAQALGLSDPVQPLVLERLLQGFSPDRQKALVMNAGSPHRCCGWDSTLSAPKSFSTLWALATPELRERFEAIHDHAVEETMEYLEDKVAYIRTGKRGTHLHRAKIVVAVFRHYSSRNLDPHLHSHCLIANLGVAEDKTNALLSPELYAHKMDAGAIYRASLAASLQQEWGVEIERKARGLFEIRRVPPPLLKAFSSRREAIYQALEERRWHGPKAAAILALTTRPEKREVAQEVLHSHWRTVGQSYGFSTPEVTTILQTSVAPLSLAQAEEAITPILKARLSLFSSFTEQDVLRVIALEAPGRGLDGHAIQRLTTAFLASEARETLSPSWEALYTLKAESPLSLTPSQRSRTQTLEQNLEWELYK